MPATEEFVIELVFFAMEAATKSTLLQPDLGLALADDPFLGLGPGARRDLGVEAGDPTRAALLAGLGAPREGVAHVARDVGPRPLAVTRHGGAHRVVLGLGPGSRVEEGRRCSAGASRRHVFLNSTGTFCKARAAK